MRKAFTISIVTHVGLLLFLYYYGWERAITFAVPQVYRVQLVSMPQVQAAPVEETVPEVDVETIPPPPEQKKKLKPKQKEAQPKAQQTERRVIQQKRPDQNLSGMRSDEQFEFLWYLRLVKDKIERNWRNPYSGEALGTIYFCIQRNGQVTDARVEKSSGEPAFDRAALRAVINSSSFPQLPPDYKESRLTLHIEFES
ncbi:MAG: TonB C-terminal domain-containing protein [Candidatus Glassbacteria bacterium]|nr:TonB C-terminal domain-containing protein [Candidatus Glassbacteria bacterium]